MVFFIVVEDDKVPGDDDATPATRRRSSGMVAEMVTLSGSRREALRREPSCLTGDGDGTQRVRSLSAR